MKILLLNTTGHYHAGCQAVMSNIYSQLSGHDILPVQNAIGIKWRKEWNDVDWVICNGEGTLHHDTEREATRGLLQLVREAQQRKLPTAIINALWQDISTDWTDVVHHLDYFSVRECSSRRHAKLTHGRIPDMYPDLSYTPRELTRNPSGIGVGQLFNGALELEGNRCNIFTQTWDELIQSIADSEFFVTGRHHEMYAACIARTPFVVYEGNSWKNQALMKSADASIPVLKWDPRNPHTAEELADLVAKSADQYKILWDFLDNFPPQNLKNLLSL